jgi:hypothetical protein
MSITPMEVESHLMHAALATGNVVICGLGMGYIIYKMLQNPNVTSITVVEQCPELIENFEKIVDGDWYKDPKVSIVQHDALTYVPDQPIDYLYVDIAMTLFDEDHLEWTQQIQSNVQAKEVGFWGQELEIINVAREEGVNPAWINAELLTVVQDVWELPLAVCRSTQLAEGVSQEQYVQLCKQVATARAN